MSIQIDDLVKYVTIASPIIAVSVAMIPVIIEIFRESKHKKNLKRINYSLHSSLVAELESNYRIITKKDTNDNNVHELAEDKNLMQKTSALSMEIFKHIMNYPDYLHWFESKYSRSKINELWDYCNIIIKIKEIAKHRLDYSMNNNKHLEHLQYEISQHDINKIRKLIDTLKITNNIV
ncbi:MAG: hypothetical protein A2458_05370 [Candidatus Kerfeldbacteria bacterium RIFOXYC2_FULL_38_9]|nr:MAG: hypothetical protein A2458_05370 [Candidatus Kerfeldbacteria bacterium RIFOXYC2_FULL_38_9]